MINVRNTIRSLKDLRWNIGFIENSVDDLLSGAKPKVRLMKHKYKDRWFADPFILDVTDTRIYVLVEEMVYPDYKGRISKLSIDKQSLELLEITPLLTLDTHLSYPIIVRKDNRVFVYPESGESGKLMMYEYDMQKEQLVPTACICDEPLGDATITKLFGEEYMFCTRETSYNGDTISVFKRSELSTKFQFFKSYAFGDKIARPAGDLFEHNGKVYRPSQDCNKNYGHGTVIQEVSFESGEFRFNEVTRYESSLKDYKMGIHTLNFYKGLGVVDVEGFFHTFWGPLLYNLAKLYSSR